MGELFVYSLFFGVLFFFFPVFVYVDGYADVAENKAWFALCLFRRLKVYGGYGELRREGVALHLTEKKAVLVPYATMPDTRKKFEITKGFQLWRYHQIVEVSGADRLYGVMLAAALQSAGAAAFSVLKTRHPFVSLKSNVLLTEQAALKISVQFATVFNTFILTLALIKKGLEEILKWIKEKRSTASWKRLPSN